MNTGKTEAHTTGKVTATLHTRSPWGDSNSYSHEHMWNHNAEHATKQSTTARKTDNSWNGDNLQNMEGDQHNANVGELSSNLRNKATCREFEMNSQASISDTTSESSLSESETPFQSMGLWIMNGGTDRLELVKVPLCGTCFQDITQKN